MDEVVELEVPARPQFLATARLVAGAVGALVGSFDDDRVDDVRLAVSEAATNAIEASPADALILLRVRLEGQRVEVTVQDHGGGFDPDGLEPHPPAEDPARLDFERGLGIPLIEVLATDVSFEQTVDGTTVRMVFDPRPAA